MGKGKKSKTSRKGKKAWRANISTEDIEDFFDQTTKDALSGGNLSAAPSEDLFHVKKSHDLPVRRKIEKHREKVLRYDSVLKKNPFVQAVSSSKPTLKKSKKTIVIESEKPKQVQKNGSDDSVMMDLWGDSSLGELDKSNPRKIFSKPSIIPAVEIEPPGCSYKSPTVAQEMQKVYKTELGPSPVPLTIEGDEINEDERYFLEVDNSSEGEEEYADIQNESSEGVNKLARTTRRVTRVEFNKRCRRKALKEKETKEKAKEKISNEIDSLPNILKEIAKEDEDKQNKHIRRVIAKEEVLKIRPPRLGKHKFEAAPVQVLLTEEMTGSLRKLKACCTLARDRFKSLEKRGILVPSKNIRRF